MKTNSAKPTRLVHEESYKGRGLTSVMHRRRLHTLIDFYRSLDIPGGAAIADFGCSNGFILSELQRDVFGDRVARIHGFDHSEHLLELARTRNLPNSAFDTFDLNELSEAHADEFDIVTCFETLEHVGNAENAFENLFRVCRPGGLIIISIPNEKGLPGIIKYVGRRILRRNAYDNFFDNCSEKNYFARLLLGRPIDGFRHPSAASWGPHLGFDWEMLVDGFIQRKYVAGGALTPERRFWTSMRFNVFLLFRKAAKR